MREFKVGNAPVSYRWRGDGTQAICSRCERIITHPNPIRCGLALRRHMEVAHGLECAFCLQEFRTFQELADHVRKIHMEDPRMSYQPPEPEEGSEGSSYPPFLRPDDVSYAKATKVKIKDVRETPDAEFSDFAVDVTVNGKVHSIGVKLNSMNHQLLTEICGKKWVGKTISVLAKRNKKRGRKDFVAIVR